MLLPGHTFGILALDFRRSALDTGLGRRVPDSCPMRGSTRGFAICLTPRLPGGRTGKTCKITRFYRCPHGFTTKIGGAPLPTAIEIRRWTHPHPPTAIIREFASAPIGTKRRQLAPNGTIEPPLFTLHSSATRLRFTLDLSTLIAVAWRGFGEPG